MNWCGGSSKYDSSTWITHKNEAYFFIRWVYTEKKRRKKRDRRRRRKRKQPSGVRNPKANTDSLPTRA